MTSPCSPNLAVVRDVLLFLFFVFVFVFPVGGGGGEGPEEGGGGRGCLSGGGGDGEEDEEGWEGWEGWEGGRRRRLLRRTSALSPSNLCRFVCGIVVREGWRRRWSGVGGGGGRWEEGGEGEG